MTQRNGMRCSTAVAYLHPALPRPNLTLIPMAFVTRVVFDGSRASGVEAVIEGAPQILEASGEVILCAGAYQSPQLLMLSGIGPADELSALGVDHRAHRARRGRVVDVVALLAHVGADRLLAVAVRHLVGRALVALQR